MENGRSARRRNAAMIATISTLVVWAGLAATAPADPDGQDQTKLVPIEVNLPKVQFRGTPKNIRAPRVKRVQTKAGPPFLAPVGTKNVALGKPVTSSDSEPVIGELAMVTDGDKEAGEGSFVELGPLLQQVTIDLQREYIIYGLRVWHYHLEPRVYFDVIIQVSNDPNFVENTKTIFNNDMDNSAGLGTGEAMHYVDTHFGELFDAKANQGRYVRLYSRGNTADDLNHYIEVEVYGKPAPTVPRVVPLILQYPRQESTDCFGRWTHVPYRENIPARPAAPLVVPEGTRNVALGKPTSTSYPRPIIGALDMITDGNKKGRDVSFVELGPGVQHITIDLEETYEIYAVAIWHCHRPLRVYFDVIVQLSETRIMPGTRGIVYNSDLDNSAFLGVGWDKRYVETHFGKVIAVDDRRSRYVRLYSNGNSMNEFNHYVEVEVYGRPVK